MYDENLHITPDPKKGFPEPDIPADEAWSRMSGLLDAEMPVQPPEPPAPSGPSSPSGGGILGGGMKLWMIGAGIVVITGALIWGVMQYKQEISDVTMETISDVTKDTMSDVTRETMSDVTKNKISGVTMETISDVTKGEGQKMTKEESLEVTRFEGKEEKTELSKPEERANLSAEKKTVVGQSAARGENKAIPEKKISLAENQQGTIPPAIAEAEAGTPPATEEKSLVRPSTEPIKTDTSGIQLMEPLPVATDTAKINPTDQPVPGWSEPASPLGEEKKEQGEAKKPEDKSGSKNKGQRNGNLEWYLTANGSIGEVVQNGRKPNPYFGGMLTAGLWNKKMEAGIETGIGWEEYKDYGSVTTTIRWDSIPADTLGHMTYIDTTRIEAYTYRYQYLQVPLFVTKQLFYTRKFSFDLKTGPLVGFRISDRRTLDYTSGPAEGQVLGVENKDYTRLKLSWQWQVIPQFRWNITDKLSLTLSPACTFYLNNLYEKGNRPAGTPFGFGVYGGLIYRF